MNVNPLPIRSSSTAHENSPRVSSEKLHRFTVQVLTTYGLSEEHARTVGDVLVTTDTWGTFSHGTNHLRNYCNKIRAGGIDPKATPVLLREDDSWAMVDGQDAIGMIPACYAMDIAVTKAQTAGIGFATVCHGSHFGAAGYYANMAATRGMIGLAMSNSDPNMVVPGGRGHIIGNNPFSYAIPNGDRPPVFLDIALSVVAASKVIAAKKRGESIPPDWIVNGDGIPTADTNEYPGAGSLLPMSGHKGYGLAFMVEALAGVLSGAAVIRDVSSWLLDLPSRPNLGHAFLAINVPAFVSLVDFSQRMQNAGEALHDAPKAKGSDRIYLPGEMEWERRADALAHGISLPTNVMHDLGLLAEEIGVDLSEVYF